VPVGVLAERRDLSLPETPRRRGRGPAGLASRFPDWRPRIAVLTPYRAQLAALRSALRKRGGAREEELAERVDIATVDGYQGREADVVIFSAVRAKPPPPPGGGGGGAAGSSSVGFLADVRRMNVALTRARRCLWVVGHVATLAGSPPWLALLRHAAAHASLLSVPTPFRRMLDASAAGVAASCRVSEAALEQMVARRAGGGGAADADAGAGARPVATNEGSGRDVRDKSTNRPPISLTQRDRDRRPLGSVTMPLNTNATTNAAAGGGGSGAAALAGGQAGSSRPRFGVSRLGPGSRGASPAADPERPAGGGSVPAPGLPAAAAAAAGGGGGGASRPLAGGSGRPQRLEQQPLGTDVVAAPRPTAVATAATAAPGAEPAAGAGRDSRLGGGVGSGAGGGVVLGKRPSEGSGGAVSVADASERPCKRQAVDGSHTTSAGAAAPLLPRLQPALPPAPLPVGARPGSGGSAAPATAATKGSASGGGPAAAAAGGISARPPAGSTAPHAVVAAEAGVAARPPGRSVAAGASGPLPPHRPPPRAPLPPDPARTSSGGGSGGQAQREGSLLAKEAPQRQPGSTGGAVAAGPPAAAGCSRGEPPPLLPRARPAPDGGPLPPGADHRPAGQDLSGRPRAPLSVGCDAPRGRRDGSVSGPGTAQSRDSAFGRDRTASVEQESGHGSDRHNPDRDRGRGRDSDRDRDRDKGRDRDRQRDRPTEPSGDRDRDRDRDRGREADLIVGRDRDGERNRDRERYRDRDRSYDSDRHKERARDRDRDR
jgi:hypothetical protein